MPEDKMIFSTMFVDFETMEPIGVIETSYPYTKPAKGEFVNFYKDKELTFYVVKNVAHLYQNNSRPCLFVFIEKSKELQDFFNNDQVKKMLH